MSEKFDTRMNEWREQIDSYLEEMIKLSSYPSDFKDILRYALFPGGKRLRPVLFLEWHNLFSPPDEAALMYACSIELMHSYSLIHDDMPCMDNDDMRRGKPSLHKQFGEAKALLAGDALLDMAYNYMFESYCHNKYCKPSTFFTFSGDMGIIHGQYLDMYKKCKTVNELLEVYRLKTGSLIKSSCVSGYIFMQDVKPEQFFDLPNADANCVKLDKKERMRIEGAIDFGEAFGVAFQLYDDISEYVAGEMSDGTTILDFLNLDEAKELLNDYLNKAIAALNVGYNGDTSYLRELVEKFVIL